MKAKVIGIKWTEINGKLVPVKIIEPGVAKGSGTLTSKRYQKKSRGAKFLSLENF